MSWLGNGFREEAKALSDAYASMYEAAAESEVIEEGELSSYTRKQANSHRSTDKGDTRHLNSNVKAKPSMDPDSNLNVEGYSGAIANSTARVGKGIADAAMNVARGAAGAVGGAAKNVHNAVAKDVSTNKKPQFEEAQELEENRRAARTAGGYRDDSKKQTDPSKPGFTGIGNSIEEIMRQNREIEKRNKEKTKKEEADLLAALSDAYAMMYEKKKDSDKCGEGTYWDSEEKKCKSKKKKSSTTVVVGRGGYYGGGHHHGGSSGGESGGEGETEGGTDGGGDGGGGGGE